MHNQAENLASVVSYYVGLHSRCVTQQVMNPPASSCFTLLSFSLVAPTAVGVKYCCMCGFTATNWVPLVYYSCCVHTLAPYIISTPVKESRDFFVCPSKIQNTQGITTSEVPPRIARGILGAILQRSSTQHLLVQCRSKKGHPCDGTCCPFPTARQSCRSVRGLWGPGLCSKLQS